jgi:hypothetical protein
MFFNPSDPGYRVTPTGTRPAPRPTASDRRRIDVHYFDPIYPGDHYYGDTRVRRLLDADATRDRFIERATTLPTRVLRTRHYGPAIAGDLARLDSLLSSTDLDADYSSARYYSLAGNIDAGAISRVNSPPPYADAVRHALADSLRVALDADGSDLHRPRVRDIQRSADELGFDLLGRDLRAILGIDSRGI